MKSIAKRGLLVQTERRSIRALWPFIAGGALGVLLGIPVGAPVFETTISDAAATLWGAAAGAIAAISGAFWISDIARIKEQKDIARAVRFAVHPTKETFDQVQSRYGAPSTMVKVGGVDSDRPLLPGDWADLYGMTGEVRSNIRQCQEILDMMAPLAYKLGGGGLTAYIAIKQGLFPLRQAMEEIQRHAQEPNRNQGPTPAYMSTRQELSKLHDTFTRSYLKLRELTDQD